MATNLNNSDSTTGFSWDAYYDEDRKYDESPIFKQGIAIIRRNGKFGAVMVGGKEIVPPIYDDLSEFEDGYAVAKWNGEERVVNLSGQVRVLKGEKEIFLPEEYDWGFDFIEDICVVVKNDKYGIIDFNFNVKHDCEFDSFTNYHNGYAIFSKNRWSEWSDNVWSDDFLIDNKGIVSYKIEESFADDHKIVCCIDNQQKLYGVIDSNMQIIIPIIYTQINRLKNGLYVADSKDGVKLFLDSEDGVIISEKVVDDIVDISKYFFCTYREDKVQKKWETSIYTSPESLQLRIPSKIHASSDEKGNVIFGYNNLKYRYDVDGNLYVIAKITTSGPPYWEDRWNKITERKVKNNYLDYIHIPFSEKYEIIEDNQNKKGLCDLEGNVVLLPQYNEIIPFSDELFIVASPCANGNTLVFGVVDIYNKIKVPFVFKCLLPINKKFLAYTDDKVYDITEDNKYYKLNLPSFNSHYSNIKFGIIDLDGNKLTTADYSTITSPQYDTFIIGKEFGKHSMLKYGVVNSDGCYILEPKYDKITYSGQANCFITNLSYSDSGNYPYETKSNQVSIDGFYLIQEDKDETVLVPAKIADWCDNFSENGLALVIKDGHKGHINRSYQIVAFNEEDIIVVPEKFDFSGDFKYGFAPVSKNNRYGIINTKLEQILSCDYEYIEPLSAKSFKFKKDDQWGIVDSCGNIIIDSKYISIYHEAEAFIKVKTSIQNGSCTETRYGLYNEDGNLIIQEQCENIVAVEHETQVFFIATINGKQGVYDNKGSKIIPLIYDRIDLKEGYFMCHMLEFQGSYYSYQERKIKSTNKYNLRGEQLLALSEKQIFVVPAEYDLAYPSVNGLIIVIKEGKWGIINMLNDVIVEPQYCIIDFLDSSLARVGKSGDDYHICFQEDRWHVKNIKYGLIDTTGEVVLPLEYERIELWDNGYYSVKNGTMHQILTPCLKVAIDLKGKECEKLDNRYIIVNGTSNNYYIHCSLIDFHGNEIIPENEYNCFSEIEVLDNGFLKVIFYKSQYKGDSHIGIIDQIGKEIYRNNECDDISLIGNGYLLVKGFLCTRSDGGGHYVYNVVNLQGKELFEYSLNEIKLLEDGNFSIRGKRGWGFSNRMGNIIAPPRYENELEFENGFADISIAGNGETLKINSSGNIQVRNDKEAILLPNVYYWGSNFKYGISIVRSIERDYIGVVNIYGEEIIPAIHKSIKLLSDRTILCREDDCYGLYNTKGKCILPVIFSKINHVAKNRIRVVWNLEIARSWDKDKYERGNSTYKFQGSGTDYEVNQRAALCDSCGTILNDKQNLYVSEFTGKYAKVYNEIKVENYKTILSQAGVIDLDGNTLVPPEYDRIFLYEHSFAKLRKGKIWGIANLSSKKITMFESLQIIRMWDLDEFGRCLYSTDWTYDKEDEEWKGTKGVLSFDGVIVPPKKYDRIILLENGLIEVHKDNLIGLLDKSGKELLSLKYSYISNFKGKYASICFGGAKSNNYPYNIIGGKWGMIDDEGNIVSKCENNEELVIPTTDSKPIAAENATDYRKPTVLLSDYIPEEKISYSDNYYYDNYDDEDNEYSKYGGYNGYDDQTIDDAFEGDPSLTWNID